jgi:enamine deaminase RidA (YjgF/YER057c/UK114 family)
MYDYPRCWHKVLSRAL